MEKNRTSTVKKNRTRKGKLFLVPARHANSKSNRCHKLFNSIHQNNLLYNSFDCGEINLLEEPHQQVILNPNQKEKSYLHYDPMHSKVRMMTMNIQLKYNKVNI